ncbi:hypothetical protein ICM05_07285 [Leucobacter sp. cx-42]|uniref:hypothetical protein n=1 Tax=unclassified Leucobacter TaxID=2621730 RepID=UPI00165D35F1|nr:MULTISPECIES: hypothetical protein [unclassified Leucobacter]MBC9954450.1 hypothetical protein [Leucobacter sp. cx-42]
MSLQTGTTSDKSIEQTFLNFLLGTSARATESTWWDSEHSTLAVGPRGDLSGATVIASLHGEIGTEGEELELDGRFLIDQVGYAGMAFHPITAPTLVFASGEEDYEVFLEDADLAHNDGIFADRLTTPSVVLADPAALVGESWTPRTLGNRFTVRGNFIFRGRSGARAGSRVEGLDTDWAQGIGSVDDSAGQSLVSSVVNARRRRPWLPRYRRVIQVLQGLSLADRAKGFRVSGFGLRFNKSLAPFEDDADRPVLLAVGEELYLVDSISRRRFRISYDVARTVESLSASPFLTPEEAVAKGLGVRSEVATKALHAVTEAMPPANFNFHPSLQRSERLA